MATTGELVQHITDDIKTIARDEVLLVGDQLKSTAKAYGKDLGMTVVGGALALVAAGLLAGALVVVLGYLIGSLWVRMLIVAAICAGGAAFLALGAIRDMKAHKPDLTVPVSEAKRTVAGAVEAVKHHA